MKKNQLIDVFNWIFMIIFILFTTGIMFKPMFYDEISFVLKIMVSIFMMYKFNDFRGSVTISETDQKLCFMAGSYLFVLTCGDYAYSIFTTLNKTNIKNYFVHK
jgi:hypothetical protein